ncbi:hypothetical protein LCGC14_2662580, partial [marine sediment metagenome]
GGMVYVEPPKFSDVYVCHTITKLALKHVLFVEKKMVIIT